MSIASTAAQNLARQLLALEAVHSPSPDILILGNAVRVCEKLRAPISKYTGSIGYSSLVSRALALAASQASSLKGLQVASDGTVENLPESKEQQGALAAEQASVVLVSQLLELLITFIGESMTASLVCSAWPNEAFDAQS